MQITRRQTLMLTLAMAGGLVRPGTSRAAEDWRSGIIAGPGGDVLEYELTDGTLLRLAGILPGPGGNAANALEGMLSSLLAPGRLVRYLPLGMDRYGFVSSRIADPDAPEGPDLQSRFLAAGLVWAWPEPDAIAVHAGHLAAERIARQAGTGIWSSGRLPQQITAAMAEAELGRPALWRARILRVDRKRGWTHCDCGMDWKTDPTISIPDRLLKPLAARGIEIDALPGALVEARGVPIWRYGPALELWHAAQLVRVDPAEA